MTGWQRLFRRLFPARPEPAPPPPRDAVVGHVLAETRAVQEDAQRVRHRLRARLLADAELHAIQQEHRHD